MTPSIPSPRDHIRNSHYLASTQTQTCKAHLPPSSFSRSSATVKSSLRKLPSTLFSKSPEANSKRTANKVPMFLDEPQSMTRRASVMDHPRPLATSPKGVSVATNTQSNAVDKATAKSKSKTRKALSDILSWGNSNHSVPSNPPSIEYTSTKPHKPITVAAPAPSIPVLAPTLPPKQTMPCVLKKRPSRPLLNKPSQSALSSFTSLRIPKETPQTRARPSMGEDPFSRRTQGAEVVDTVSRHGASSINSASTAERRESVESSKALSTNTLVSEEPTSRRLEPKFRSLTPTPNLPVEKTVTAQQRHVSAPLPSSPAILANPPPRSASLGRVLNSTQLPSPPPSATKSTHLTLEKVVVDKSMSRNKTRSKVWGIFKSKKGKRGDGKETETVAQRKRDDHFAKVISQPVAPSIKDATVKSTHTLRSVQQGAVLSAQSSHPPVTGSSNSTNAITWPSRPRPPFLHIQNPSGDGTGLIAQLTGSSMTSGPLSGHSFATGKASRPVSTDSPLRSAVSSGKGGVWETVVGSVAERPSIEGPRTGIVALMAQKGVPKRKSLSGLFDLAVKKSMDKIRPQHHGFLTRESARPGPIVAGALFRSLAEEMENAESRQSEIHIPSSQFVGRFGDEAFKSQAKLPEVQRDLRRVASATDKLFNLVSLDFSPISTPSDKASLATPSLASLDGSPTPIRRIRSAVITTKRSLHSPISPGTNISPLKLSLHRSLVSAIGKDPKSITGNKSVKVAHLCKASQSFKAEPITKTEPVQSLSLSPVSPPKSTSLVKKGMKNIFAPPTPPRQPKFSTAPDDICSAAVNIHDKTIVRGCNGVPRGSHAPVNRGKVGTDVPDDLQAMILDPGVRDSINQPESSARTLGLPPMPPADRVSPRRPARAPPAISLPPVPDLPTPMAPGAHAGSMSPQLSLKINDKLVNRDSYVSDYLLPALNADQFRASFDFTKEYARLDQGDQRASFVEALTKVQSFKGHNLPLLPPMPDFAPASQDETSRSHSASEVSHALGGHQSQNSDDGLDIDSDDEQASPRSAKMSNRTPRPAPFQGNVAFQKHLADITSSSPPRPSCPSFDFGAPASSFGDYLPPLPNARRRHHHRDGSEFTIASMSSLGSIVDAREARDYPNYFEVDFANHVDGRVTHSRGPSIDSLMFRRSHTGSHHRRNSSIASMDSVGEVDSAWMVNGPPVSMHNSRRSSFISRHLRGSSGEGSDSFGRPDWAAHRRNSSVDSTASSVISFARLGRPGLGEKMFQLDRGIQLTSITASPPEDDVSDNEEPTRSPRHQREWSLDSWLDANGPGYDSLLYSSVDRTAVDSIFGSGDKKSNNDVDSVFASGQSTETKGFFLKGLRPLSMASIASSVGPEDAGNETFVRANKYTVDCSPLPKGQAMCFEGGVEHEDDTMTRADTSSSSLSHSILNVSNSRPARPRRRPANLVFVKSQPDTPALSSPSASETSSRLSLETRFSGASVLTASRVRPIGAGHHRRKSSAGVKLQATIKEEPSIATLRAVTVFSGKMSKPEALSWTGEEDGDEPPVQTVRSWIEWQREAEDECRRARDTWTDNEESKRALAEFRVPKTFQEIVDFLAQSAATYKPLEQLPNARSAHRLESSLSKSRSLISPYGLPLPKPNEPEPGVHKPKTSLLTKFERTHSTPATSSTFTWSDEDCSPGLPPAPLSAVFAQFAREIPPSPPPTLAAVTPFSPFRLSVFDIAQKDGDKNKETRRSRVTSFARRQALGWGRRRNSDGPTKVEALARGAVQPLSLVSNHSNEKNSNQVNLNTMAKLDGNMNANVNMDLNVPTVAKGQENVVSNRQTMRRRTKSNIGRKPKRVASHPRPVRI